MSASLYLTGVPVNGPVRGSVPAGNKHLAREAASISDHPVKCLHSHEEGGFVPDLARHDDGVPILNLTLGTAHRFSIHTIKGIMKPVIIGQHVSASDLDR